MPLVFLCGDRSRLSFTDLAVISAGNDGREKKIVFLRAKKKERNGQGGVGLRVTPREVTYKGVKLGGGGAREVRNQPLNEAGW